MKIKSEGRRMAPFLFSEEGSGAQVVAFMGSLISKLAIQNILDII